MQLRENQFEVYFLMIIITFKVDFWGEKIAYHGFRKLCNKYAALKIMY